MSEPISAHASSKPVKPSYDVTGYHQRKADGRCVSCCKKFPRKTGRSRCVKCARRHSRISEKSRQRNRKAGLVEGRGKNFGELSPAVTSVRMGRDVEAGLRCKRCWLLLTPGWPCEGCPDSIDNFAGMRRGDQMGGV